MALYWLLSRWLVGVNWWERDFDEGEGGKRFFARTFLAFDPPPPPFHPRRANHGGN